MQAYQPQPPYQSPVYLAPLPPQQTDSIDSVAKVIELFQKLQQSTGGNFAPGQTQQASASVGQMAPVDPQKIAYQEALLRNPELARQQSPQVQQQQEPGSLNLNAQQAQALQQNLQVILQGANQHYQQLQIAAQMCNEIMNAFNAMCAYAGELEKTLYVAHQHKIHADAFAQELDAAHEMIGVLQAMLTNPEYLVNHAFTVWDQTLQGNVQGLDQYISPAYMQLVANVEERYKQQSGQYSPKYSEYLQQRINQPQVQQQLPQQIQQPQQQGLEYIKQFAEMLQPSGYNTSELGAAIRRQHIQRLRG